MTPSDWRRRRDGLSWVELLCYCLWLHCWVRLSSQRYSQQTSYHNWKQNKFTQQSGKKLTIVKKRIEKLENDEVKFIQPQLQMRRLIANCSRCGLMSKISKFSNRIHGDGDVWNSDTNDKKTTNEMGEQKKKFATQTVNNFNFKSCLLFF